MTCRPYPTPSPYALIPRGRQWHAMLAEYRAGAPTLGVQMQSHVTEIETNLDDADAPYHHNRWCCSCGEHGEYGEWKARAFTARQSAAQHVRMMERAK